MLLDLSSLISAFSQLLKLWWKDLWLDKLGLDFDTKMPSFAFDCEVAAEDEDLLTVANLLGSALDFDVVEVYEVFEVFEVF